MYMKSSFETCRQRQTLRYQHSKNYNNDNNICDIEYEREITKRLEIEKNFQLEMRKLDLRRLEIDHEYHEKQLKKNI